MYIREVFKIGGIIQAIGGTAPYLDWSNCVIVNKKKNDYGLVLQLERASDGNAGTASLKFIDKSKENSALMNRVFVSKNIMGLTLNQLNDFKIEDL